LDPSALIAFAGVALTAVVVPGPDWAFVMAAGLRNRSVVPAVGGLLAGYALITAAAAAGIGPLATAAPLALVILTVAGAAYLIYLGIAILRSPAALDLPGPQNTSPVRAGFLLRRGVGVSALNPKALLFFLAILPQFVRPAAAWPAALQMAALGGVWVAICAGFYLALGYAANRIFGARPRLHALMTRTAGWAMIIVGIVLLGEQVVGSTALKGP
jgi:threonine/homoserine/homoserine lactone efflux protein